MPWQKGQSGNLKGRPANPAIEKLRKALNRANIRHKEDFLDHFVDLAYKDTQAAIALAKKLLPDLKAVEGGVKSEGFRLVINYPNSDSTSPSSVDSSGGR